VVGKTSRPFDILPKNKRAQTLFQGVWLVLLCPFVVNDLARLGAIRRGA
jgi:hypothetical protein